METQNPLKTKEQTSTTNLLHFKKLSTKEHVNNLFDKRFLITDNECYPLPDPQSVFKCPVWEIEQLQTLKKELNDIKSSLNSYKLEEWQIHTRNRNSAKNVMPYLRKYIKPEFLTQAWCKFYEIVSSFPLVPVTCINNNSKCFKSVHLCEAPGAFITSLNHWLKTNVSEIQWDWIATTLNPYYEGYSPYKMVGDDRFIKHTLDHWCFGEDNTGDLMSIENLNELIKMSEPCNNVFLVTADGSIDCTDDPGEQENIVAHLHFCETVAALHLLQTGGSFLLKIFTTFECHSICLMYFLCCCFNEVSVVKPATSKEGNSESYIVCTNFKGQSHVLPFLKEFTKYYECGSEKAMFNKDDIPCSFISRIIECSKFFKCHQSLVIMNNIITFKSDNTKMLNDMKQIQYQVVAKYITDYNVRKLMLGEIVGNAKLTASNGVKIVRMILGSYNERYERHHLAPWDQLKALYDDTNKLEIEYPSDKTVELTVNKLPGDLQISLGKAFHTVLSSRLCHDGILRIKTKMDDILVSMGHKIEYPHIKKVTRLKKEILSKRGRKIITFQYTDIYDSHRIIVNICETVHSLDTGDILVLVGYSLLTCLNVGLLYLLSCTFDSLIIQHSTDIGSMIILKNYRCDKEILKNFTDIKDISSNIQQTERAVLQIIPATILYECDLLYPIVNTNHWIIKSYIHYVFTTLEKHIKEGK
ncbi:cap methyltransferase 2 [Megalopta genalis]|uniref:cap methyltransferase 2 n=1 Tax=Megalopta genalis TaxID=115081 RepID=UPI003FD69669